MGVVVVVGGGLTYVATRPGNTVDHVRPNDGTVWVTNDRAGLFGRLNGPAARLDAAAQPDGAAAQTYQLDIVEADGVAFARDRLASTLTPIDPVRGTLITDNAISLDAETQVATGAGTTLAVDPVTGEVRGSLPAPDGSLTTAALSGQAEPLATVRVSGTADAGGSPVDVAVDAAGIGYAVGTGGDLVTLTPRGGRLEASTTSLQGALLDARLLLTPEGPVVLDLVAGTAVHPSGERMPLTSPVADAVVQQQPVTTTALIATPESLLELNPATGTLETLADGGSGAPATPLWIDDCAYAVWAGTPGRVVRACEGADQETVELENATNLLSPKVRVDRRTAVLNDAATGAVWDLATGRRLDNWDAVAPPSTTEQPDDPQEPDQVAQDASPPKAQDDEFGARAGRTSVLHPLDNDSNPSGSVLSIVSVTAAQPGQSALVIAPDGQSIQLGLDPGAQAVSFQYTIDDGKGTTSTATVTVTAKGADENSPPVLRERYEPQSTTVANRGIVSIPAIGDWRDPESDPVVLTSATDAKESVPVTSDGRVRYTAPTDPGPRTLGYVVSDGRDTATGELAVVVLPPDAITTTPPRPLPDVARGDAGQPIVLRPLDNDLPGTDPLNPGARLELAGDVLAPEGTTVATSPETGAVTVTAAAAGTYLLSYTVRYGDAAPARGTMRVDVIDPAQRPEGLTAVLDQAVIHGRNASIVDVLANDVDPSGRLLVVQSAVAEASDVVDVAVLRGRWVRIAATRGEIVPNPLRIQYTITNGTGQSVTGDVSVVQLPMPADGIPNAVDDTARVRSGDTVSIAPLDNDSDPAGQPLRLLTQVEGADRVGTLPVSGLDGITTEEAGAAYVSGSTVRFQAPTVTTSTTSVVDYVVENSDGQRATGAIRIRIEPPPSADRPDRAPVPSTLEGRLVSGDSLTISIPTSGADPDGDSVTLSGIASAPQLGRILEQSPSSITYQAYPTSGGTDEIGYIVSDRFGKTGTGTIRIAVAPPGDPQPVVAVDDLVTVAPGRALGVDVLSNDIQPIGEQATVQPLAALNPDLPEGVALDAESGVLGVVGPAPDEPFVVRYSIVGANGQPSQATLTVRGRDGTNLPPLARNAVAVPDVGATSVSVDVLTGTVDPDDAQGRLNVTKVFNVPGATIDAGTVTVPVTDVPQVLSFEVADAGGAVTLGLIHVAVGGSGAPYVKPDTLITVDRNGTATVKLSEVILDPGGKPVILTTTDRLSGSPAGVLSVADEGTDAVTITASNDYIGPAAIAVEVTNGADATDPAGRRALLTIPVQIGPETPVLRCPTTALDVVIGGSSRPISIRQLCHVWTARPETMDSLQFTGSFPDGQPGLQVTTQNTDTLVVSATADAEPGSTARLLVTAAGTLAEPAEMTVRVAPAAPPTLDNMSLVGIKAGSTGTINLRGYLTSPLGNPDFAIVGPLQPIGGSSATVSQDGPTTISVTPSPDAHGLVQYRVTVTDSPGSGRADRTASGILSVDVLGVPGAPGAPVQVGAQLTRAVVLAWSTPPDNGLPIEYYDVSWNGGTQRCSASPCRIENIPNDVPLTFTVRARNGVGDGPESGPSDTITADEIPGAPGSATTSSPRDGALTVTWEAAPSAGSPVQSYLLTWPGGQLEVAGLNADPTGLDNLAETTFSIRAKNKAGYGPPTTVTGQSAGTPAVPGPPTVTPTTIAGGDAVSLRIDWSAVSANGLGSTTYTVVGSSGGGASSEVCRSTLDTSCMVNQIDLDGTTHAFAVIASNAINTSAPGASTSYVAVGAPGDFSQVTASATGVSRQVELSFRSPAARDSRITITCEVAGTSCGSWEAPTRPTSFQELITVPADGQGWEITLTATNSAGQSTATTVTSDVVYGPLGIPTITGPSAVGPYITFTVSVDPKGLSSAVEVVVDAAGRRTTLPAESTGSSGWSKTYTVKVGYDVNAAIAVTVTRRGSSERANGAVSTSAGSVAVSSTTAADGTIEATLALTNASPSTAMSCTIDGQGNAPNGAASIPTNAAGSGQKTLTAAEFAPVSGRSYLITCDDGQNPSTPLTRSWAAP
ncbi:MAG: fibronectin type III domain-containing protein [Phycicoccus sp.]|nr:fibronectin type III domain-containing protein [Phycicoccus sp.]